jgi:uncharacterized protein (TIGR03067 family)
MRTFALTVTLLALAGSVRADEIDPEPPGGSASVRKLKGAWKSVRMISKGKERTYTSVTYKFSDDKVTYTFGGGKGTRTMTLKTDKKRPNVIEMTVENSKVTNRYFFKFEKGELYLQPDRSGDPKAKPDFTGNTISVLVLQQEKK